jgi:hypothetical protein
MVYSLMLPQHRSKLSLMLEPNQSGLLRVLGFCPGFLKEQFGNRRLAFMDYG